MGDQHLAAVLHKPGEALKFESRQTPSPGPSEFLISVSAIAVNPIDYYQRDHGFPPIKVPAVLGSDIAGTVLAAGNSVFSPAPKVGDRVVAFAIAFFKQGEEDYGGFQTKVLVPAVNVTLLPDDIEFKEAVLLPMAVATAWAGMTVAGVPRSLRWQAPEGQGLLVWGGASSIGSAAIQVGRVLGFRVYTTASAKNHDYLEILGASRCFDYKSKDVVNEIVVAAKADRVVIGKCFDAAGQAAECLEILRQTKGENADAIVASAIPLKGNEPQVEGVDIKFVVAPDDEEKRNDHFQFIFNTWLTEQLEKRAIVPSLKVQLVPGGLEALNEALDLLRKGVSGVKLVVET